MRRVRVASVGRSSFGNMQLDGNRVDVRTEDGSSYRGLPINWGGDTPCEGDVILVGETREHHTAIGRVPTTPWRRPGDPDERIEEIVEWVYRQQREETRLTREAIRRIVDYESGRAPL